MLVSGQCHCGNLRFTLETGRALEPRECQCGFCRMHAARCASDPQGQATVSVGDTKALIRYRFGLKTADFLVCGCCGVYLGALLTDGDESWSTLNLRTCNLKNHPALAVSYDNEQVTDRIQRRKDRWTPTRIV